MGDSIKWQKKIKHLLWKMFDLQYGGSSGTRFRWMQGFADGYIQAYIDLGIVDERVIVKFIQNERKDFLERFDTVDRERKKAA